MSPRETDAAQNTTRFSAAAWAIGVGTILGAVAGMKAAGALGVLVGVPVAISFIYSVTMLIVNMAGRAAGSVTYPTGKSTPLKRDYSLAQSFVVRERYEDAISAYELACAEYPDDPEPYLRLARLYRDKLRDLDEAILWFKRARAEPKVSARQEQLITFEIVEIYRDKLGVPAKAIPELARLAERFVNTAVGDSAKQELRQLRDRAIHDASAGEFQPKRARDDDDSDTEEGYVSLQPD